MTDLIERLEAVTEGSRELDQEVAYATNSWPPDVGTARHFSRSLDAALTLVPEGWGWAVAELDEGVPTAVVTNREPQLKPGTLDPNPKKVDFRVKAATPALAVCAAALRARKGGDA